MSTSAESVYTAVFATYLKDIWFTVVLGLFLLLILKKSFHPSGKTVMVRRWKKKTLLLLTATAIHLTSQLFTLN